MAVPTARLVGALLAAPVAVAVLAAPAQPVQPGGRTAVIVTARPGAFEAARAAVRAAGGAVGRELAVVDGFASTLPARALPRLARNAAIRSVTPDGPVRFASYLPDPAHLGSTVAVTSGATSAWQQGDYGAGPVVALVDTGVAPSDDFGRRVIAGPDFSGEGNSRVDRYGHGTVMAGIIAGSGYSSRSGPVGSFPGMAPRATVLSVKVAGRNGATDVSQVLAALTWVDSYRAVYGIRAVNLSWGTVSDQSARVDPLNYAVERLWADGIVVVTSAGNDGPSGATITKPGDDPAVLTVGAYDDAATTAPGDDTVPAWTSHGPTASGVAKPDLVAPGRRVVAVASTDSDIYANNPSAHVGASYIRGSGTSQATAVVSGLVALLLKSRPDLTPDEVKHALTSTASPLPDVRSSVAGRGRVSLAGAMTAPVAAAPIQPITATGTGSLEASRGGRHVQTTCRGDSDPTVVVGEIDALCRSWDAAGWTRNAWTPANWSGNSWSGDSWSGDSWSGDSWSGDSWSAHGWSTAFWDSR
jgi:serine protease AprX